MFKRPLFAIAAMAVFSSGIAAQNGFDYPKTKKVEQVDDYHGTKVADPYRWMEETTSPEVQAWIEAQNKLTNQYLAAIPERDKIKKRMTEIINYERYSA